MEYLWIFLLILFIVLIVIFLIWAWNNNDNDNNDELKLSCNKIIKVINTNVNSYDVYVTSKGQTISQSTLPHMGESTICKPQGNIDIVATDNKNNTIQLKDIDVETSNFLILADDHSFFTNNLSEGKQAKFHIKNDYNKNVIAIIKVNKSMWTVNVEANGIMQAESKFYHELYNHNQPCLVEIYVSEKRDPVSKYHSTKNDLQDKYLHVSKDGVLTLKQ